MLSGDSKLTLTSWLSRTGSMVMPFMRGVTVASASVCSFHSTLGGAMPSMALTWVNSPSSPLRGSKSGLFQSFIVVTVRIATSRDFRISTCVW